MESFQIQIQEFLDRLIRIVWRKNNYKTSSRNYNKRIFIQMYIWTWGTRSCLLFREFWVLVGRWSLGLLLKTYFTFDLFVTVRTLKQQKLNPLPAFLESNLMFSQVSLFWEQPEKVRLGGACCITMTCFLSVWHRLFFSSLKGVKSSQAAFNSAFNFL